MSTGRILYWLLVGALFGFGVIAILSVGILFISAGLLLLGLGAFRFRGEGLWAGLVGFGAAPALLLLWDVSHGWTCAGGSGAGSVSPSGGDVYSCVSTPIGVVTTYHVMAAGFGAIALVGLLLGLAMLLRRRGHTGAGTLPA